MQKKLAIILSCLLALLLLGCQSNTKESLNAKGESLFKEGNYNGAIIHYKNALEKDPNYVDARFNLGLAYIETKKLDQAEREFQKVLLLNPYDKRVNLELGRIANLQNKPDKAVPLLEKYQADNPKDAAVYEQLAFSAALRRDFAQSRKYLEQSLALEPGRISAQLGLVRTLMDMQDFAAARAEVDSILKKDPKDHPALHALAQLQAVDHDNEGMLATYTKIAGLYPNDLLARYKAGALLVDKGELEKVKAMADSMLKDYPNKAEGYKLRGLLLYKEKNYHDAILPFQRAIQLQPDLESYYLLGLCYYQTGSLELAVSQLQTVVDYNPSFLPAHMVLGDIFLRQRRAPEALAQAQAVQRLNPQDPGGYAMQADALLMQGKADEALAGYDKASSLAPKHYGLLLKKGLLRLAMGKPEGEQDLKNALEAGPPAIDARLALHALYQRTGRDAEAKKVLSDGLTGTKTDAVIYNALARDAVEKRDFAACDDYIAKAKQADPGFLKTYFNAAAYRLARNKPDQAVAEYDQALAQDPNNVAALIGQAAVLDIQGKQAEVLADLEKAKATGDPRAYIILARYYQKMKQDDKVMAVLDEGMTKHPDDLNLVQTKAGILMAKGETNKAMALYSQLENVNPWAGTLAKIRAWASARDFTKAELAAEKLISMSPNQPGSYLPLASIKEAQGDIDGAAKVLDQAAGVSPDNLEVLITKGEMFQRAGKPDQAMPVFEAVLQRDPENASALTGKGMILQMHGKRDEAIAAYRMAVESRRDFTPALNNLAMLYVEQEKTRVQALNLAMAAFVSSSSDPRVIDTLGYVLLRNNRAAEAQRVLDRALAIEPNNPSIIYHMAMANAALGKKQEALAQLQTAVAANDFPEKGNAQQLMKTLQQNAEVKQ
ncbi:PEP-CTERM system TPR-repeat lipoprotein [Desulfovibrio sp. X2]|uniref:XrtA/PEP-CTERM system TPR-repeat protein PrsT n=1 Tax=Desulfovibrio sp. X2 TaxID=941449 RepID=UPI000358B1BB|nr:XrtA/PEP-CTERM system TPR-repeat protein PrsT [Desulfovibrio sp. X2]EPR37250.1 PEP-CTERM system TPR-repeat lipoprotein [Desulfovibrio sp. X2]